MENKFDIYDFDVVGDIMCIDEEFENASELVSFVKEEFSLELEDEDDRPFVYIGMVMKLMESEYKIPKRVENAVMECLDAPVFIERIKEGGKAYSNGFEEWKSSFIHSIKKPVKKAIVQKEFTPQFDNWKNGDIYAININNAEKPVYAYLNVIKIEREKKRNIPIVVIMVFSVYKVPTTLEEFDEATVLPTNDATGELTYPLSLIDDCQGLEKEVECLYIGNRKIFSCEEFNKSYDWARLSRISISVKNGIEIYRKYGLGKKQ